MNKWTHIAIVTGGKETDEYLVYFDGILPAPNVDKNLNLPAGGLLGEDLKGLVLGCWLLRKNCARMYIDEFRVWNKTRTLQEIRSTMNKKIQKPKATANLYAYYNFNDIFNNNEILGK